jgi:hypothetical protein
LELTYRQLPWLTGSYYPRSKKAAAGHKSSWSRASLRQEAAMEALEPEPGAAAAHRLPR